MRATGESATPADLLCWLEMTVCLLGQELWNTGKYHRLLWLAKFIRNFGKAASILKEGVGSGSLPCDDKKGLAKSSSSACIGGPWAQKCVNDKINAGGQENAWQEV